jgi:hypothetical protein
MFKKRLLARSRETVTLPDERYRAVQMAQQLCYDLMFASKTPRVPKEIRDRARAVLRHFPDEYYMSMLAESRPDILERRGEPYDPLYVMVKEWDLDHPQHCGGSHTEDNSS